jgi:hypothetical protein
MKLKQPSLAVEYQSAPMGVKGVVPVILLCYRVGVGFSLMPYSFPGNENFTRFVEHSKSAVLNSAPGSAYRRDPELIADLPGEPIVNF